jgi:hypothetical protein
MGLGRQGHSATSLSNGKVLVAGGVSYFGGLFPTSAEIYDPITGKWSPTIPLLSGRTDHIAARLPDGRVLLAGGFNTSDTGPSAELFDPASVVPFPPVLGEPTRQLNGDFQFTFRNTPGFDFTVLGTADVTIPVNDWTNLGKATEVSPGHYQFADSRTVQNPFQFYRVRSP